MAKLPRSGVIAAATVFVADQASKYAITDVLGLNELSAERVLAPIFALRFVANRGVSLGLLHANTDMMRWGLVAMTAVIATLVAVWMTRERNRQDRIALGLILGGAIGNILDRVRYGYVVDFADLHFGEWRPFLVFNVADAAITIGVLVLLVRALLMRDKRDEVSENSHA
ncbi:MAG TPA: signal peptidase II [Sphingomonas sp.]|jgi:signal peptidase II